MAYTEKRPGGFVGRYRVDGKLKSTPVFKSVTRARDEATKLEQAGKTNEWVDPSAGKITLGTYFEAWQKSRTGAGPRTRETAQERFDSLIAPTFGATPLQRITYEDVQRWTATLKGARGKEASAARKRDSLRLLLQVLDGAVKAGRLARNPARDKAGKVDYLPRVKGTKAHRYLSDEQLRRVADASGSDQTRVMVQFLGLTGLRWGEASALTVADVDLLKGRVTVSKAYTRLDDGTLLLGDTKTHANRTVPVAGALKAALAEHLNGRRNGEHLFATADGSALRRESFDRNAFRPAARVAGAAVSDLQRLLGFEQEAVSGLYDAATVQAVAAVQEAHSLPRTGVCDPATWAALAADDKGRREGMTQGQKVSRTRHLTALARVTIGPGAEDFDTLTLHDLRHTAASIAISKGANVKVVQRLLGHESARLTLDTYAGLFPDDLDALGESMGAVFEGASWATLPEAPAHPVLTGASEQPAGVTVLKPRKAV